MKNFIRTLTIVFIVCSSVSFAQRAGTRVVSDSVRITNASTLVSAASVFRMSEILVNMSTGNVHVSFKTPANDSSGTLITPNGSILYGAYTPMPWNGVVYARADSANATLTRTTVFIQ